MRSRRLRYHMAIWLSCVLLAAQPLPAQQYGRHNWDRVRNLATGTSIWVKTKAGDAYHGELIAATAQLVQLDSDERAFPGRVRRRRELLQQDVAQVREFSKGKSALLTLGIGAGVGACIGFAINGSARSKEDNGIAPVVFTLLGGFLGWAIGQHCTFLKGAVIYDAS